MLTRYFSLCLFSCGIFIALARWVCLPSKLPYYFVIFPNCTLFLISFRFSFLNLELFVTDPLFKSSLKKDRAILSETSGQRKLVCWCWGRAKRLTWPSKNPKNYLKLFSIACETIEEVRKKTNKPHFFSTFPVFFLINFQSVACPCMVVRRPQVQHKWWRVLFYVLSRLFESFPFRILTSNLRHRVYGKSKWSTIWCAELQSCFDFHLPVIGATSEPWDSE